VRYAYQPRLTREITGQFLQTARGPVKLFAWTDPQSTFPSDALRVHAADVRALLVRAAAVDSAKAYELYDLDGGATVPLSVSRASPTTLTLTPAGSLRPGRYAFVATHEGMFGGRDFDYLRVVARGSPATQIASNVDGSAPQVADALLPLAAALLAFVFAVRLGLSWRRRPAAQKAFWGIGFAFFGIAATAEAVAYRHGWSPGLFRIYYVAGGVLTVAWLGAGSAWLLLPRRARDLMLGALLLATAAAVVSVFLAPVHGDALALAASGRPPANHALRGHAFLWAIALNSFGTLFLVGGSAWSIVRRQRVQTNVWIGTGALITALATGLSRADTYALVYAGDLVGIALMFFGFTVGSRSPSPKTHAAPAAAVPAR
jgi:hypothetical protein